MKSHQTMRTRLAAALLLTGLGSAPALAAPVAFNPAGDSIITFKFTPNLGVPGSFTTRTYKAVGGNFVFDGSTPGAPEIVIPDVNGGSTSSGNASADATANEGTAAPAWGAGSGVGQTDPANAYGGNASETRITVDLKWNIDDAWNVGSRTVYQLLPVKLSAVSAGDSALVSGSFNYTLDLDTNGSIDKSAAISYTQSLAGPSVGLTTTIYKSALLSATPIAAPGAGLHHLFRITGTLVFQATDPLGNADAFLLDPTNSAVQLDLINYLNSLDPNLASTLFGDGDGHFLTGGSTAAPIFLTSNDPVPPGLFPPSTDGSVPSPAAAATGLAGLMLLALRRNRHLM